MSPDELPLDPKVPLWLLEWRETWQTEARKAMNPETTTLVSLSSRSGTTEGESLWWLPGVVSLEREPRTDISNYGVFGHLWVQKSSVGMDKISLELTSTLSEDLLMSFASIQVQQPEDVQRLAGFVTHGLQDAMKWLTTQDQRVLSRWAGASDPLFRRIAETSPHAENATRVMGYLSEGSNDSLLFPLPPSKALQCTRRYIAKTLCTAILMKGAAARDGLASPLRF